MSTTTKGLIDYLKDHRDSTLGRLDADLARMDKSISDGQLRMVLLGFGGRQEEAEKLKHELMEDTLRRDVLKMKKREESKSLERLLSESKKELERGRSVEINNESLSKCCVVCLTNQKNSLLYPCNHANVCKKCADTLYSNSMNCPTCRSNIISVHRIYDNL